MQWIHDWVDGMRVLDVFLITGCSVVERVMSHVARRQAELVVATHNQESVESAIRTMDRCGIPTHSPGMCLALSTHQPNQ